MYATLKKGRLKREKVGNTKGGGEVFEREKGQELKGERQKRGKMNTLTDSECERHFFLRSHNKSLFLICR